MAVADAADASVATIVQWEILIAAPPDDVVTHGMRAETSTTCSSHALLPAWFALRGRLLRHGADRCHRGNRQERAEAAGAALQVAAMPLPDPLPILHSALWHSIVLRCPRTCARAVFTCRRCCSPSRPPTMRVWGRVVSSERACGPLQKTRVESEEVTCTGLRFLGTRWSGWSHFGTFSNISKV